MTSKGRILAQAIRSGSTIPGDIKFGIRWFLLLKRCQVQLWSLKICLLRFSRSGVLHTCHIGEVA